MLLVHDFDLVHCLPEKLRLIMYSIGIILESGDFSGHDDWHLRISFEQLWLQLQSFFYQLLNRQLFLFWGWSLHEPSSYLLFHCLSLLLLFKVALKLLCRALSLRLGFFVACLLLLCRIPCRLLLLLDPLFVLDGMRSHFELIRVLFLFCE